MAVTSPRKRDSLLHELAACGIQHFKALMARELEIVLAAAMRVSGMGVGAVLDYFVRINPNLNRQRLKLI